MNTLTTRRRFLKRNAAVAGVAAGIGPFNAPAILASRSPNSKLGTAIIARAARGMASLGIAMSEQLVALVGYRR